MLGAEQHRDLLELLDDFHGRRSTVGDLPTPWDGAVGQTSGQAPGMAKRTP